MIPKIEQRHRLRWHASCCALALNAAAFSAQAGENAGRTPIGLFTTMPIYWGESESLGELLQPEASSHWVGLAAVSGRAEQPRQRPGDGSVVVDDVDH
jgi:hypothetical protein